MHSIHFSTFTGSSATTSYTGNCTTVTDESSKARKSCVDGLGRLTTVYEDPGSSPHLNYQTNYTYDALNNLTGVTQSSSRQRSFTYDSLSRLVSSSNPESNTEPVSPYTVVPTTYSYDANGNLISKAAPAPNQQGTSTVTTTYTYDYLNRITGKSYNDGHTPSASFNYDANNWWGSTQYNTVGRLVEEAVGSITVGQIFSYDSMGRVTSNSQCTPYDCGTGAFTLNYSYDLMGNILSASNGQGVTLSYAYNGAGMPTQMTSSYQDSNHPATLSNVDPSVGYWANGALDQLSNLSGLPAITYGVDGEGRPYSVSAGSGQNPVSSTTYNVASLPTAINFGSSDSDGFTYDSNTNRMTQYSFNVNSSSVVGALTWNSNGTLAQLAITDPFNSANAQTCTYSHDDLSRIAQVSCGTSGWGQSFTYDAFGNITKSVLSGHSGTSFAASYSTSTNQMTSIGGSSPTYDSNGNITNDFLNTYAWDSNGRPVTVNSVGATYDALGRMVEQNRSGTYTQIVYAPSGGKLVLMSGSTLQKSFVPLPGGAQAVYNSSGLAFYRHADWVGSSRFASTPSRTMYYDGAYSPFGEAYAGSGTTDLSFTGMNQDTSSNVYDFPAREYGIQGRWPSPDPAGIASVSPKDPQTWNRYAYVRNNPLALTDPTGMCDSIGMDDPYEWYGGEFRELFYGCGDDPSGPFVDDGSNPSSGDNNGDTSATGTTSPEPGNDPPLCSGNCSQSPSTCDSSGCTSQITINVTSGPDPDDQGAIDLTNAMQATGVQAANNWIQAAGAVEAGAILAVEVAPVGAVIESTAANNPETVQQLSEFGQGFSAGVAPGSNRTPPTPAGLLGWAAGKAVGWYMNH